MPGSKGAPVRTLLIIMLFWATGRVAWIAIDAIATTTPQDRDMVRETAAPAARSREQAKAAPVHRRISPAQSSDLGAQPISVTTGRRAAGTLPSVSFVPSQSSRDHDRTIALPTLLATDFSLQPPNHRNRATGGTHHVAEAVDPSEAQYQHAVRSPGPRLAGYFWLFARQPGRSNRARRVLRSSNGRYGASQAGAVLSYRLAGRPDRDVSGYTRVSTALVAPVEQELALGLKAKPINTLPVTLFVEQRLAHEAPADRGRAVFVAGGLNPTPLPMPIPAGTTIETYVQAGYLFHRDKTYIFDGLASIQYPTLTRGKGTLSLGGGLWAGGDKDTHRIDIGPRAELRIPVHKAPIRIAIDWRQRIGGQAEPDSGLAATISTGF